MIEQYPDSEYARSAILKFDLAFDHLAAKEMEIGRYYLKRGHYSAAINRFRVVVEEFQTTTHTPEALMRLVEAYLALGLTDEAQTAGAICCRHIMNDDLKTKQVFFMTIDKCKFRKPVVPGDQVRFHMTKMNQRKTMWWFRGEARVDGALVAQAEIGAMLVTE